MKGNGNIQFAAQNISRTLLLPKELAPYRDKFTNIFQSLIRRGKFKIHDPSGGVLTSDIVYRSVSEALSGALYSTSRPIRIWLRHIEEMGTEPISQEKISELIGQVNDWLNEGSIPENVFPRTTDRPRARTLNGREIESDVNDGNRINISQSVRGKLQTALDNLITYIEKEEEDPVSEDLRLSMNQLVNILNNSETNTLLIIQGNRDNQLRQFTSSLVFNVFNRRRQRGWTTPQVLFIFDEADEFMPRETANDSYQASRSAITTLARRGRKFGLGVSFATQRVAYLDTSIIAQAHTHLISKLPRQCDREVVSQAFGLSDDMLRRTLKFSKGQWLLVSYDATGLENVPLPVYFPNANQRIIDFFHARAHESTRQYAS